VSFPKYISCLTERENKVICLRFGAGRNLQGTADHFGTTPERVREIEVKALRKMRYYKNKQQSIKDVMSMDFMPTSKKEKLVNMLSH
jgi:DNA-directed RNA polymerase sigma subunit (sigma70/sigma32)